MPTRVPQLATKVALGQSKTYDRVESAPARDLDTQRARCERCCPSLATYLTMMLIFRNRRTYPSWRGFNFPFVDVRMSACVSQARVPSSRVSRWPLATQHTLSFRGLMAPAAHDSDSNNSNAEASPRHSSQLLATSKIIDHRLKPSLA